jgi:AraC-like DNA-binding protein
MDSTLSLGEVAYLLVYPEPSRLSPRFKRWNGITPLTFPQRQSGSPRSTKVPA